MKILVATNTQSNHSVCKRSFRPVTHYSEGCIMCNACREMWISLPIYSNVPLHTTRSTQRVRHASSHCAKQCDSCSHIPTRKYILFQPPPHVKHKHSYKCRDINHLHILLCLYCISIVNENLLRTPRESGNFSDTVVMRIV